MSENDIVSNITIIWLHFLNHQSNCMHLGDFFLLQFLLSICGVQQEDSLTHSVTHTPQYGSELTRPMNICSAPGRWNGWNGYHRNHLSELKPLTCPFTTIAQPKHSQTLYIRESYMLIRKWTQQCVYLLLNGHYIQLFVYRNINHF